MFKFCHACNRDLPIEAFAVKSTATGHLHSKCRECVREYSRKHYEANRSTYIERAKKNNADTIDRKRAYVAELRTRPCMDCGGTFPEPCMEFDHRAGRTIKGSASPETIAMMKNNRRGIPCLIKEIEKCDVICANCHRLRTHKRRLEGWKDDSETEAN